MAVSGSPLSPFGSAPGLPAHSVDELLEQPARSDDLCVGGADPVGQFTVGGHHDHVTIGSGDGGDRVVAIAGRVYNLDAVHLSLVSSRPASPLEYNGHR